MSRSRYRIATIAIALVVTVGCVDSGRELAGSLGVVEVIETPGPIALEPSTAVIAPLSPEFVYYEPPPPPVRHVARATLSPSGAVRLGEVQSIEVDVEVAGGAYGTREIAVVFVSSQGMVWERQLSLVDARPGQDQVAHFSLPVASTFIEERNLSGTWKITTLDDGVEQASATFALEE